MKERKIKLGYEECLGRKRSESNEKKSSVSECARRDRVESRKRKFFFLSFLSKGSRKKGAMNARN